MTEFRVFQTKCSTEFGKIKVKEKGNCINISLEHTLHIVHEKAICHNPPIHNFTGDRKKLDRSITDQDLSTPCFYRNIK
jgi:hypothetical protein